jgi:N-acetylglucosaminyldiphosphoundecaprenol N-acetyl-beta-D-mannosaminyltransferase
MWPMTIEASIANVLSVPEPIDVMNVRVVPWESYTHALAYIEDAVESGRKTSWVAINPQKIYRAWHEPELLKVVNSADVGICDGIGVSIASRIVNGRGIPRCTGCDLFFAILPLAAAKGWRVFLLGATPESNAGACAKLVEKHPDLRIVGTQDGYFEDASSVIRRINDAQTDLLFVAMGSPKQEYWIHRHRQRINASFCMGVGGSFDVASGTARRAPSIFRKTGTEFLFQLMMEPKKRWQRQKVYFPYMLRVLGRRVFGSSRKPTF